MAMGFYFRKPQQQASFEREHKPAIAAFSYITIAYQLFFVSWLGALIDQPLLLPCILVLGFVIYLSKGFISYWALAFYLLSIGLFVSFLDYEWPAIDFNAKKYWPHAVLPLAIGFIFSPYLDITFHRAYRESKSPKLSFSIGFGVLFLSLLGFVFCYAGSLGDVFFNQAIPSALIYPIIGFLALQTAFTIAAHCSELNTQKYLKPSLLAGSIGVFSLLSVGLLSFVKEATIPVFDLPLVETIYKGFLFFYSLVFPLYLLFGKSKSTFMWLLGLCTPAYAIGFLIGGEHSYSLTIGVAILFSVVLFKRNQFSRKALS